MEIRDAVPEDWPRIWPFLRDIVRAGETYTWPTDVTEDVARAMWMAHALPYRTVVAVESGGDVMGTAKMGPNHLGPGSHIANASFMVNPDHGGKGVGRALGQYVLDQARADGFRAMQFNAVVSTNAVAVKLWQSLGFDIIATLPEGYLHAKEGYVGLHIMFRSLVA
ncbi:GNAT family N-acetyltransferase [Actinophytocola algeriensis]|uniref:L-amino acid N-acyltransferase YncA n=1 Tax=Actinophytocola algeriensis TaxID=1768010 RepID=A0A7W7Q580_9PSEU|nr:GNAT family N-acetyltransferase [Actinophytocola algeriensis]MBB4907296.1 L-amino acid N-acyltransferase YncA [Actinophytocola algeriensis]MBE1478779.1 L-amino acid N-acyltransferase YncA [Actinophytocola algeriensis]